MAGVIYSDAQDAYEKTHFFIQLSGVTPYQPNLPKFFIENNVPLFHEIGTGWQNAVTTPKRVVDMLSKRIEFFFEKPEDKQYVAELIQAYINKVTSLSIINREDPNELAKCRSAIAMLKESHNARANHYAQKYPDRFAVRDIMSVLTGKIRSRFKV